MQQHRSDNAISSTLKLVLRMLMFTGVYQCWIFLTDPSRLRIPDYCCVHSVTMDQVQLRGP